MRWTLFLLLSCISLSLSAQYQTEAARIDVELEGPEGMKIGKEAWLSVQVQPKRGWHVYSMKESEEGAYNPTQILVSEESKGFESEDVFIEEGTLIEEYDEIMGGDLRYYKEKVFFAQRIKVDAAEVIAIGSFEFMACNDVKCIPLSVNFSAQAAAEQ